MRFAWLLLPLLAACTSNPPASQEASTATRPAPAALPRPDTAAGKAVSAQPGDTLRVVRQQQRFSQPDGLPDLFRLVFRGPSWLEGNGEFTITTAAGAVIFREVLTEPDLEAALVYEMTTPSATPAQRVAYVQQRIDRFFQPAQFQAPAVAANAAFPTHLEGLDRATWNDLRRRPDAIGFDYLKGKEDRRRLAWSALKKQTVRVR